MIPPERIATRSAEIGGGLVIRRALPNLRRRTIGAWCFLDHAGPVGFAEGAGLHVGPHPHIGLQTFTWMIEGAVMHRDSLGNEQLVSPGQVNIMTAGGGISHSEDSAGSEAAGAPDRGRLHAVQLWIALPEGERQRVPGFRNHPELPFLKLDGFEVRVLAGHAVGRTSPVQVYSPLMAADLRASGAAGLSMPLTPEFEHGVLVTEGAALVAGEPLTPGTLLYFEPGRVRLDVSCDAPARMIVIGGVPFAEEVLLWWNFVARRPEELEQARADWLAGTRFGTVTGSPSPPLVPPPVPALRVRAG